MKFWLCLITLMIAVTLQGCDDTFTAHEPLITDNNGVEIDSVSGQYHLLFSDIATGLYEEVMPALRIEIAKDQKAYILSAIEAEKKEIISFSMRLYPLT